MSRSLPLVAAALVLAAAVQAHTGHTTMSDDMDMGAGMQADSTSGSMHGMKMYFHGSIGSDMVWFASWVPTSAGAIAGTCIGLFLFGIFERFLAAFRRASESAWLESSRRKLLMRSVASSQEAGSTEKVDSAPHLPETVQILSDPGRSQRWSYPFMWAVDIPRGLLHGLQVAIHYLLMLVVMTFNIWFVISVVFGAAVGETMFGRLGWSEHHHH